MPRRARLDAPGALHHVVCRGIERQPIFRDDTDRENFVDRLGAVLTAAGTACHAWALLPNHVQLLLQTAAVPLPPRRYQAFVAEGIALGRRPEFTGGGLVRSAGGWGELSMRRGRGERYALEHKASFPDKRIS
jgi:hypothetical protein